MKKLFIMFAACVAAVSLVSCNSCDTQKPADDENAVEQTDSVLTVETAAQQLLGAENEEAAMGLLDGWKAKAEELLKGGDQEGYFNIVNIIKTVWENNKEALLAKIPALKEKMEGYITVPEEMKEAFDGFVKNAAANMGEAVDAAKDKAAEVAEAAGEKVDAAKDQVKEAADAAKDQVKEAKDKAVDNAKDKAADALNKAADALKK